MIQLGLHIGRTVLARAVVAFPLLLMGCATPDTSITSVPISSTTTMDKALGQRDTWWLHLKRQRGCYPFYAEYYIEAKVTRGESWDSEPRSLQSISIGNHGGWSFGKACNNTYGCSESERKYSTELGACERICAVATARDPSGTAHLENKMGGCPH